MYLVITISISLLLGLFKIKGLAPIVSLILTGPFMLGVSLFTLSFSRGQHTDYGFLFKGFNYFGRTVGAYLWVMLFTVLWSLLLIVPGIIAGISYSQTFFIMADDTSTDFREAVKKSKRMMQGNNKWRYFYLHMRFLGWALLSLLTLGIGFLWFIPYVRISEAKFYEDIKHG